ncbi:MAG: hypothetical protein ACREJR_11295 [Candidatus Rokuibacteriota bacterium]
MIAQIGEAPESVASVLFIPRKQGIEATLLDGRTVETSYPTDASQLRFQELLERRGVRFDSKGAGGSAWWSIATYLLPFVLFFGFWIFLLQQARGTALAPSGLRRGEGGSER